MVKRYMLSAALIVVGGLLLHPGAPAMALLPCQQDCAVVEVRDAMGPANGTANVVIDYTPGPNDQRPQEGNDDVAAIAFTIGIPGDGGGGGAVSVPCAGGDLRADAVRKGSGLDDFNVIVENASCDARERCLCPGEGQQADDFVNIVVYGPKDLPDGGPVEIPRIPAGELLTLKLKLDTSAGSTFDLPLFCDDNQGPAKPGFGADLSIGDQSAIDQTADGGRLQVRCIGGELEAGAANACTGDCNEDGEVRVNELVRGVNINLEIQPLSVCPQFDANGDGDVRVNELVAGVVNNLNGCPQ